ncbi:hypothetical protein T07_11549 [Trichinella nelsoni]|uniref:Uncharacterized protein n=1 Tax=Trichinella nelsoni TaxID=6336 RepID=A0A0V0RDQ9_9BILA|nr:hypothetical protein T07_11549 [Trichinella nelsoni]
MCGSFTFCNAASISSNSWYTQRNATNSDWHRFSNSVRVLLEHFCSSLLLSLKSSRQILPQNLTTDNRGGVSLCISSKI